MNKVALVTGASGALGTAISRKLAELGWSVALHYCKNPDEAYAVADQIVTRGGRAQTVQGDVRIVADGQRAAREAEEKLGPLGLVVNNAGLVRDRSCLKITEEDWDVVLDTNLKGAFYVSQAVVDGMKKRKAGRIVNISSIVGAMGNFGQVN